MNPDLTSLRCREWQKRENLSRMEVTDTWMVKPNPTLKSCVKYLLMFCFNLLLMLYAFCRLLITFANSNCFCSKIL